MITMTNSGGGVMGDARPKQEVGAGATATVGAGPAPAGVMALPGQYYTIPVSHLFRVFAQF